MKEKQRSFRFAGWGGAREGAGRPRKAGARLRHAARTPLVARHPVHVTVRARAGAPNLRGRVAYAVIQRALEASREGRDDFRVVHFSVQTNHVHLLVEATSAGALSRGVQGLAVRIARGVNGVAGRTGKLWADRFHARALRSPREVRAALCCVLQNARRHATTEREMVDPSWIDPRSSGPWFDGWGRGRDELLPSAGRAPTAEPKTWLLSTGWRRAGLIGVDEVPPAARR